MASQAGGGVGQSLPQMPGRVYNSNTGVDLTHFHYFERLPPAVRNMIYELVMVSNRTIQISSPLGKRKRGAGSNFASLMAVNTATYQEARGYYYLDNIFAVGNNNFGSRYLSNLHGLRAFMHVANKSYLSLMTRIEINICAEKYRYDRPALAHAQFYLFESEKCKELRSICRILLKHFRGLKTIMIRACELGMRPRGANIPSAFDTHPRGEFEIAVEALRLLLDGNETRGGRGLPGLRGVERFCWYQAEKIEWDYDESGQNPARSLAGCVEAHRPKLRDSHGVRAPKCITGWD